MLFVRRRDPLARRRAVRRSLARREPFRLRFEILESRQLLDADAVFYWNDVLIDAIRADSTKPGPGWSSRNMAIVHAAIYDAVNLYDGGHESFGPNLGLCECGSVEAAVAAAAYITLANLYPAQEAAFATARDERLDLVDDAVAEAQGIANGITIAGAILAMRADDGSLDPEDYTPGTGPGNWRPSFPDFRDALGPGWGSVDPFVLPSSTFIPVPPPPDLASAEYAAAFNEVKELGDKDSLTRTDDQTEIGIFWGYDVGGLGPPPVLYNQILQTIGEDQGNTLAENARLFALANIAMADAGVTCWQWKYTYKFWRPITAIREADTDGNPLTEADPDWEPLGAPAPTPFTPPFPAYASGHATFGGAVFGVLENFYGTDDIAFTIGSDELPGVTRHYESFSQAAEENGISRIYLGIHWSFDNIEGTSQGGKIADFVFENSLRPITVRNPVAGVGLYDPFEGAIFLRDTPTSGAADTMFGFGPAPTSHIPMIPMTGDWDGDGDDTPGLFNPQTSTFFLKLGNSGGPAEISFQFGPDGFSWKPVVGDWNGDGIDTVGLYDPGHGTFFLRNFHAPGKADTTLEFGPNPFGDAEPAGPRKAPIGWDWSAIAGDWDGDGDDSIGLVDRTNGAFFLKNEPKTGEADEMFQYGPGGFGLYPIAGDFDGDRRDTVGLHDAEAGTFHLVNDHRGGDADATLSFGPAPSEWSPLAGVWREQRVMHHEGEALRLAGRSGTSGPVARLDATALTAAVDQAKAAWMAAGLDGGQLARLAAVQVRIADLPGDLLGWTEGTKITIDIDAAGQGWSAPAAPTPAPKATGLTPRSVDNAFATGGVDLLTAVAHELGHVLGLAHTPTGVMSATI